MALRESLTIEQGTDWRHGWMVTSDGVPIDDTWTARAQIRPDTDSSVVLHEFTPQVTAEGAVLLFVSNVESSAWTWREGVYDVELLDPDLNVFRLKKGPVIIDPEVTR